MSIEYKIEWLGSESLTTVIVESEFDLAKYLSDLDQGKRDGFVKHLHVYQREVCEWVEVSSVKEIFKPGDSVIYQGIKHTLMVLVFPAGIATWIAIAEEIGSEATLIEESDLLMEPK